MLTLLTTVGLGKYEEVVYAWEPQDQSVKTCRTPFIQIAADEIFQPGKILLVTTPQAAVHCNCMQIQKALGDRLELVHVPKGSSERELWEIFDIVSNAVPANARLILDITHAFRSVPLLLFGVATYLRRVKGVELELIIYGAHDAGEKAAGGVVTAPIFDLTVLADLQEWLQAVDSFAIRSDAGKLSELLSKAQDKSWAGRTKESRVLPKRLKKMAGHLNEFSHAIRLLRPLEALKAAKEVKQFSKTVESEAAEWVKPFSHILALLSSEIKDLAVSEPENLSEESLKGQLVLIKHYLDKDLTVQAVLLAREWVVNLLAWLTGQSDWLDFKGVRSRLEKGLNAAAKNLKKGGFPVPAWFSRLPKSRQIARFWVWLQQLRNDVAHCAMDINPASSASIRRRSLELIPLMASLLEVNG